VRKGPVNVEGRFKSLSIVISRNELMLSDTALRASGSGALSHQSDPVLILVWLTDATQRESLRTIRSSRKPSTALESRHVDTPADGTVDAHCPAKNSPLQ
jgi:hypothetical protein